MVAHTESAIPGLPSIEWLQYGISRFVYNGVYRRLAQSRQVAARHGVRATWAGTPEQVEDLQRRRLQLLVQHAYESVPYYRRIFDERGLAPADIQSAEDLQALPLLTKEIIQEEGDSLRARDVDPSRGKVILDRTGGSTGQPLILYQDEEFRALAFAEVDECFALTGWRPGDRRAWLWGRYVDVEKHHTMRQRIVDWSLNEVFLSAYHSTPEDMARYARFLSEYRPVLIVGFPSALAMMAHEMRDRGLAGVRPRAIVSTAETLLPAQRELISSTFDCPVFDRYGGHEAHIIAHECGAHQGLHLFTDLNVVEFLENGRPAAEGQPGSIVTTVLTNFAMPLIRYVVGDVGTATSTRCSCGLPFPLMSSLQGRISNMITSPSGRMIHGIFFNELLDWTVGVRQYQVVQEEIDRLDVRIVAGPEFESGAAERIKDAIVQHGDPLFHVNVQLVDAIPASASGKFQFTISRVAQRNQL